ncbi:MAG: sensor histidine kinase [Bacteroidia bacterium]
MKKINLAFLLFSLGITCFSQNDSLEKIISSNKPDTVKLKALSDLTWNNLGVDLKKSQTFAKQELALAQKTNDQKYIAAAYNDLGLVLIKQSKFKESLVFQKKALEIRLKLPSQLDIASSYSKIGYCYAEMSDYVNSLDANLKALPIYVKLKSKLYEANTLNNICNAYNNLKNYANLMKYAERSYAIAVEFDDKETIGGALNYIAVAYEGEKQYEKAIEKEKLAYTFFTQVPDSNNMAAALGNIGFYNHLWHKDKEALTYYLNALSIVEKIKDLNSAALHNNNIGDTYLILKEYTLAEKYLKKAEQLAIQQSLQDILMLNYKSFGDLCAKTNRGEEASNYYNKYATLKDSIFSKETAKQVSDMQVKYESKQKEEENLILQKDNEVKNIQISKGRLTQLFLVGGILLLVVVFYLLYNRNKLKQKQLMDAELLQQQELRSRAIIEAEEKERTRIARELHDGIGQQLSAAKLNISGLQASLNTNNVEEKVMIQNAIDLIDESVKEVRVVSHSMMPNALIKSGLVSAVREFINKISSSGSLKVNLEIIGLTERLEQTIETVLFRVLQELVNNIIKHAKATQVSIQLIRHDTELTILIEDNGVGFNVDKVLEKEGGIGLKNIQSRVAFLNGQVFFDSHLNKGTTVTIEIPFSL